MRRVGPCVLGWFLITMPLLFASFVLGLCGFESERVERWLEMAMDRCAF